MMNVKPRSGARQPLAVGYPQPLIRGNRQEPLTAADPKRAFWFALAAAAAFSICMVVQKTTSTTTAHASPVPSAAPFCLTSADVLNISTGVNPTIGTPDLNWTVNGNPAYVSGPYGSYVNPPPSGSSWINPTGTASDLQPLGTYVYSTSFTVPPGVQSFKLFLQFASDNLVQFDLNGPAASLVNFTGNALDASNPNESYQVLHPEAAAPLPPVGGPFASPVFTYYGTGTTESTSGSIPPSYYVELPVSIDSLHPVGMYTLKATVANTPNTQSGLLVSAGVTCVAAPPGSITICKETPEITGAWGPFGFTNVGGSLPPFNLSSGLGSGSCRTFSNLAPNTYVFSEAPLVISGSYWQAYEIDCTDGTTTYSTTVVTINLTAGENIKCTFLNSLIVGAVGGVTELRVDDSGSSTARTDGSGSGAILAAALPVALLAVAGLGVSWWYVRRRRRGRL